MKIWYFILILPVSLFAQQHLQCGTPTLTAEQKQQLEQKLQLVKPSNGKTANTGTTCIPIYVHDVLNGSNGGAVSRTVLSNAITNLNYYFKDANMEFYIAGISTFNNATYYDFSSANEAALLAAEPPVNNAMNMYLFNTITSAAGYAYYPFNTLTSTCSFITKGSMGATVHEYGHQFNLYHTFEGTEDGNTDANAENVARTGIQSNCSDHGDNLCDTEADPGYTGSNYSNCLYTGTAVDIHNQPYNPTLNNFMTYFPSCESRVFTSGQISRIMAALTVRQGHSAYTLNRPAQSVTAPSGLSAALNGNIITLNWTDNANNELGYLLERSETSSNSGFLPLKIGGIGDNVTTIDDNTIASNKTYYYRIKAINGDCNTYSNVASISTGLIYCDPSYSNPCTNSYISNVTLSGNTTSINNSTSCTGSGISDYTSSTNADVTAGSSYSLSVTKSAAFGRFLYVYLDINQDGDFEDANENLISAASVNYSGTVNIPAGSLNGATRFRVLIQNLNTISSACDDLGFGETEDYTVTVSGGTSNVFSSVSSKQDLKLIPNPSNGETKIQFSSIFSGISQIQLLDVQGNLVYSTNIETTPGEIEYSLKLLNLPSGAYTVLIRNDLQQLTQLLVKY